MSQFRTIEIDFDVHRCIENERRGFNEAPNDALRRLLRLPDSPIPVPVTAPKPPRGWSRAGVTLPHGTEVKMEYNGRTYEGVIENGNWVCGGETFDSPSGAASGVALTKRGQKTNLDGWNYWKAKLPGEPGWTLLKRLRSQAQAARRDAPNPHRAQENGYAT